MINLFSCPNRLGGSGSRYFLAGFSVNGKPIRFDPSWREPAKSWCIEGNGNPGGGPISISCSFVEFDGRGGFFGFRTTHCLCEKN